MQMRLDWTPPPECAEAEPVDFFKKPLSAGCWHQAVFKDGAGMGEYRSRLTTILDTHRRIECFKDGRSYVRQSFHLYKGATPKDCRFVMVSYDWRDEVMPYAYWETDSLAFAKAFVGGMCFYDEISVKDWRTLDNFLDNLR